MKTVIIIVVVLLATAGSVAGLAAWFGRGGAALAAKGGGVGTPVRVATVGRSTLTEVVNAPGEIEPKTQVKISARVAARIAALPFEEGERVKKGDVLVRLDAKDLEAALRSAKARYDGQAAQLNVSAAQIEARAAALEASRVALADAERTLRRQAQLFETKDVSQQDVEQAQAQVDQLRADMQAASHQLKADKANLTVLRHTLEAAKAEVEQAEENLSYAVITSPIDGTITKTEGEVGELVVTGILNSPGTVIMTVADLSKMLLVARVDESAIASVKEKYPAKVRAQAYADRVFPGVVESVALAKTDATDGSKHFEVKILVDTQKQVIQSGLTADVDIETRHHDKALVVPSQSVLGRPSDDLPPDVRGRPEVDKNKTFVTVVYRVVDGKATVTPVKVGPSDLTHTEILSGISEGDQVIIGPYKVLESLTHGQLVKAEDVATPAAAPAATTRPATQPVARKE